MAVTRRSVLRGAAATGALVAVGIDSAAEAAVIPRWRTEVLVVGGGTGGVAAALAVLQGGRSVVLTEPTSWVGGQLTSQAVPPDEHQWIEQGLGGTRLYLDVRASVRAYFKANFPVTEAAQNNPRIDPGNHWSSRLAAEPSIWHAVLRAKLQPYLDSGKLRLVLNARPTAATRDGAYVRDVRFSTRTGVLVVEPRYVVEASELGDLLPLANIPHVVGREKGGSLLGGGGTGEMHNRWDYADPLCQQAFTVVASVGYAPPKAGVPVNSPLFSEFLPVYKTFGTNSRDVFDPSRDWSWSAGRNFWQYRRVRFRGHLTIPEMGELTLLNQPQNDCLDQLLIPATGPTDPAAFAAAVARGRDQTLGLVQYFQTTHPRPDGSGRGWSRLFPAGQSVGTSNGVAMYPYVRESRRILSQQTIYEYHVGIQARQQRVPGAKSAFQFDDSVGIGAGPIDIHPTASYPNGLQLETFPFQIPLKSLFTRSLQNVLAGGKALGTTHLTNGCYRFHPVEWNVGEAAGHALAFVLNRNLRLSLLPTNKTMFNQFASYLTQRGVQRSWPADIRGSHVASMAG